MDRQTERQADRKRKRQRKREKYSEIGERETVRQTGGTKKERKRQR